MKELYPGKKNCPIRFVRLKGGGWVSPVIAANIKKLKKRVKQ